MEMEPAQDPSYLRPGTQVGEWRVVSRRGRGSYGAVYRVERVGQEGGAPFALKMALHAMDERFEREVELLSRVRHPNVPGLKEWGVWRGAGGADFPYLVMEWVEGEPLYTWAARSAPTSRQVLKVLGQVVRALAATHGVEAVHRDVKGENVLVEPGGRAVLTDFGSCWYRGARRLTRKEEPAGTPQYWSPEALNHQWRYQRYAKAYYEARPADDVYALGVMAYRMVTGNYPPGWGVEEVVGGVVRVQRVEPEVVVTVSAELSALIRQMLEADPKRRGSAEEVAEAFERAAKRAGRRADRPIIRKPVREPWSERVWRGVSRPEVAWLGWLMAAMGGVVALGNWGAERMEPEVQPPEVTQVVQGGGKDGGTSALGDGALAARVLVEEPVSGRHELGVEVPKEPLPGQRRPPCRRHETEIYGGCWLLLGKVAPPCGDDVYEWKNGCYSPSYLPGRPATSKEP